MVLVNQIIVAGSQEAVALAESETIMVILLASTKVISTMNYSICKTFIYFDFLGTLLSVSSFKPFSFISCEISSVRCTFSIEP